MCRGYSMRNCMLSPKFSTCLCRGFLMKNCTLSAKFSSCLCRGCLVNKCTLSAKFSQAITAAWWIRRGGSVQHFLIAAEDHYVLPVIVIDRFVQPGSWPGALDVVDCVVPGDGDDCKVTLQLQTFYCLCHRLPGDDDDGLRQGLLEKKCRSLCPPQTA